MAKRLGFKPEALIRSIPDPKQKWKQPVRGWVRSLYEERFGHVLGEKTPPSAPASFENDEEAARRFEEELYWEDYWERNADDIPQPTKKRSGANKR